MNLENLNGKSLAECKGIVITEKLYYSKANNYPYVRIKEKGAEESIIVLLSVGLAADLKGNNKSYPSNDSVFHVYADEESGEQRIKLGRPPVTFVDATTIPAWG
jgi:hypothetical protein